MILFTIWPLSPTFRWKDAVTLWVGLPISECMLLGEICIFFLLYPLCFPLYQEWDVLWMCKWEREWLWDDSFFNFLITKIIILYFFSQKTSYHFPLFACVWCPLCMLNNVLTKTKRLEDVLMERITNKFQITVCSRWRRQAGLIVGLSPYHLFAVSGCLLMRVMTMISGQTKAVPVKQSLSEGTEQQETNQKSQEEVSFEKTNWTKLSSSRRRRSYSSSSDSHSSGSYSSNSSRSRSRSSTPKHSKKGGRRSGSR